MRRWRGEQFEGRFGSLHPYCKLTVPVDPDGPAGAPFTVFESGAIPVYLAEKTRRLMGVGAARRATAMQ